MYIYICIYIYMYIYIYTATRRGNPLNKYACNIYQYIGDLFLRESYSLQTDGQHKIVIT